MPAVAAANSPQPHRKEKAQRSHARREKVIKIAKTVFTVLLTIAMALLQTPITVTGFIAGIAFKPQMEAAIKRIKELFKQHTGPAVCALILSSIIAFPIIFLAVGFGTGAYVGMYFPFTE